MDKKTEESFCKALVQSLFNPFVSVGLFKNEGIYACYLSIRLNNYARVWLICNKEHPWSRQLLFRHCWERIPVLLMFLLTTDDGTERHLSDVFRFGWHFRSFFSWWIRRFNLAVKSFQLKILKEVARRISWFRWFLRIAYRPDHR